MAKIVGEASHVYRRFTCLHCCAIVEYAPREEQDTNRTDEGCKIKGLHCPRCHQFHRTNP